MDFVLISMVVFNAYIRKIDIFLALFPEENNWLFI